MKIVTQALSKFLLFFPLTLLNPFKLFYGYVYETVTMSLCRFNVVYFIMLIQGVGTLLPWNMFITAHAVSIMIVCMK